MISRQSHTRGNEVSSGSFSLSNDFNAGSRSTPRSVPRSWFSIGWILDNLTRSLNSVIDSVSVPQGRFSNSIRPGDPWGGKIPAWKSLFQIRSLFVLFVILTMCVSNVSTKVSKIVASGIARFETFQYLIVNPLKTIFHFFSFSINFEKL